MTAETRTRIYDFFKLVVTLVLVIIITILFAIQPLTTTPPGAGLPAPGAGTPVAAITPPAFTTIIADEPTGDTQFAGTGQPGAEIILRDQNGVALDRIIVADDGTWQTTLPGLTPGDYAFTVESTDPAGVIAISPPVGIVLNPPRLPNDTPVAALIPPTIDYDIGPDGLFFQPGPTTLTGTGQPGAELEIQINSDYYGGTVVNPDGTWQITVDLPAGELRIDVYQLGVTGQVVATAVPVYREAGDLQLPSIDRPTVSALVSGTITLTGGAGSAFPGQQIEVRANGEFVGRTLVDDDLRWALSGEIPAGEVTLVAILLDEADFELAESRPLDVAVFQRPLIFPPVGPIYGGGQFALIGLSQPGTPVTVFADGQPIAEVAPNADGVWTLPVEFTTTGTVSLTASTTLQSGLTIETAAPLVISVQPQPTGALPILTLPETGLTSPVATLSGTAIPGSTVEIQLNGDPIGLTTTDADGRWSFDADTLPSDPYEITLLAPAFGLVTPPIAITPGLALPSIDRPASPVSAGPLTLTGSGQPGATLQLVVDGVVAGTTVVGPDGRWSLDADLSAGERTLAMQQLDNAGRPYLQGPALTLAVDAPAITPTVLPTETPPGTPAGTLTPTVSTPAPTTTPRPTSTPTNTPTNTPTSTPTGTLTPTVSTPAPTTTPRPTSTPTSTPLPPTNTPTPTATLSTGGGRGTPAPISCEGGPGRLDGNVWIVGPCDTLTYISRVTGRTIGELLAANPVIRDRDIIFIGQRILIP